MSMSVSLFATISRKAAIDAGLTPPNGIEEIEVMIASGLTSLVLLDLDSLIEVYDPFNEGEARVVSVKKGHLTHFWAT